MLAIYINYQKKGLIASVIHKHKVKPHGKLKSKLIYGTLILHLHLMTHISHYHKSDRLKKNVYPPVSAKQC